jgi:hypothetical protein
MIYVLVLIIIILFIVLYSCVFQFFPTKSNIQNCNIKRVHWKDPLITYRIIPNRFGHI